MSGAMKDGYQCPTYHWNEQGFVGIAKECEGLKEVDD